MILLALGILSLPVRSDGSPPSIRDSLKFGRRAGFLGGGDVFGKRGEQWTEIISWEPRAFVYHNFLSMEDCKFSIMKLGRNMSLITTTFLMSFTIKMGAKEYR